MLPSYLNLSMRKMKGYSNKILVSNTDMKIDSNMDINKDHKKLPVIPRDDDAPKKWSLQPNVTAQKCLLKSIMMKN